MAKPSQVPESSMEEILASIRKIISEDEARPAPAARPRLAPLPGGNASPNNAPNNVSRLFGDDPSGTETPAIELVVENREAGEAESGSPADAQPAAADDGRDPRPAEWNGAQDLQPQTGALLSPRADAAVASAFNHLASTVLATNSRTIEQVAEDMMRPMLREWLDDNLPPLVERLVREEIDRVSRRR